MTKTLQEKAKAWNVWARVAAVFIGCTILAPAAMIAVQGLVGLLLFGFICVVSLAVAPAIGLAAANLRLKLLKGEASRNPVETLQGEYLNREKLLEERKDRIERFQTKVNGFESKLEGFKRQFPEESAKFDKVLSGMQDLLSRQKYAYKAARAELKLFGGEIEKAQAVWEMSIAASDAAEGTSVEEDFFSRIKTDTALDAVTDSMNGAFAQLETSLLDRVDTPNTVIEQHRQAALNAT
jgi:hypothetical protein